jgi:hypothetical protein
LNNHRIFQFLDYFLRQSFVADIDYEGTVDITGKSLNRNILNALDLIGDEDWQVVVD